MISVNEVQPINGFVSIDSTVFPIVTLSKFTQFLNAFGIPEVAGGYYISRNLENAIREVINNDSNPRETFAEYVELINSEITRKREEFEFKLGLGK